jgi:thiosulfate/3-mercaptopyruvate sulfurtransferase
MSEGRTSEKLRRRRWGPVDWALLALALVCVGLLLQRTVFRRSPSYPKETYVPPAVVTGADTLAHYPDVDVSSTWLAEHLRDARVVVADARSTSDYAAGHIPGAVSIPAAELDPSAGAEEAPALTGLGISFARMGVSDSALVVCYAENSYSANAARLVWLLDLAGAAGVRLLDGGISGWVESGGALETVESTPPAQTWSAEPRPDRLATHEYVMKRFGHLAVEIIDARGEEPWEASPLVEGDTPGTRNGHVPHSLPFEFRAFLESGRTFLDPADSRALFAQLGPRPTNPVDLHSEFIVYAGGPSGEGALAYFLLRRAGVEKVRYYESGWAQWANDPASPVVTIVGADWVAGRLKAEGDRCLKRDLPPRAFVLLDVRGSYDYKLGHIPGAVSLPAHVFPDSLDATLSSNWPNIDRARVPVLIYCYDAGCIRSRNCSTFAAQRGFLHVERFLGGVGEWKRNGGEMKRGE